MRQEYGLDRLSQYAIDQLDENIKVTNPEYSNLSYHLKRTREKISRKQARLFILKEENIKADLDKTNLKKQLEIKADLELLKQTESLYIQERKNMQLKSL